jgi:predicted ribosomally synthesized peptide with SipW-like signal peptide
MTTAPCTDDTRRRRHQLLALGAGGLVLGIGAVVTMAAWTDTERSTGDFDAGRFGLVASVDGQTFSDNPGSPGLELTFDTASTLMSPGSTSYAAYAVQLTADSDYAADVVLTDSIGTGSAATDLTYTILGTDTFGCTASTTGTELVTDQPATAAPGASLFSLDAAGDPAFLCVQVTAGENLTQGSSGSIEWTLTGTSTTQLG